MKKLSKLFLFIICAAILVVLAGCSDDASKRDSEALFKQMKKKEIVSKKYKEVDTVEECYWRSEHCQCTTYYIYTDGSSNLIAINYSKAGSSSGYNYMVNIYSGVENLGRVEYLLEKPSCGWDTTYYTYSDGSVSYNNKYTIRNIPERYGVKVKKTLFSKKYTFEKN